MTRPPQRASVITEPPLLAAVHLLAYSPFVIGRAHDAGARIDHPLVEQRHAILLEREDGWWLSTDASRVLVNGTTVHRGDHRLRTGDRIELTPGATVRFDDGRPAHSPTAVAPAALVIAARRRKRHRWQWRLPKWRASGGSPAVRWSIGAAILIVVAFTLLARQQYLQRPQITPPELSIAEAVVFDSLLTIAFDHFERANVLLEIGASDAALNEFATGITVISASALRDNAYVNRRLDQLRTSIGEVYRARRLLVPTRVAAIGPSGALHGEGLAPILSTAEFSAAVAAIRSNFRTQFNIPLEITGRDHPEHLSLYGAGGAVDVRCKTLTTSQVQFVITAAKKYGIRIKDFSQDTVLQAQIVAAVRAGLSDRAGTGLHLHMDRFPNRRDRWTVR